MKKIYYLFRNVFNLLKRGYSLKQIFSNDPSLRSVLTNPNGDLYFTDDLK